MEEIFKHLEYLALEHPRVGVPGLGCLNVHRLPAKYDISKGYYVPPGLTYSFDYKNETENRLLLLSICRKDNLDKTAALRRINDATRQMTDMLDKERVLELGNIGVLSLDDTGLVYFTPGWSANSAPCYLWLPKVKISKNTQAEPTTTQAVPEEGMTKPSSRMLYPISRNGIYRVEPKSDDDASELFLQELSTRSRRIKILKSISKYAAMAVVLVAAAVSLLMPDKNEEHILQASVGLQKLIKQGDGMPYQEGHMVTDPKATALVLVIGANDDATEPMAVVEDMGVAPIAKEYKSANAHVESTAVKSEKPDYDENGRYCIIVASLASEAEALRYISEHTSDDLRMLVKDGRYRIYAYSSDDKHALDRMAKEVFASRYPGAWVARR